MALPSMLDTTILDGTGDSSNNLSTPRAHPARRVSTTPKEDLLVSEDYSSVFKSRPKVALSPPFSPTTPRGVARVPDYSYVDDDEDDEDMGMIQSPLMRKTRPRVS